MSKPESTRENPVGFKKGVGGFYLSDLPALDVTVVKTESVLPPSNVTVVKTEVKTVTLPESPKSPKVGHIDIYPGDTDEQIAMRVKMHRDSQNAIELTETIARGYRAVQHVNRKGCFGFYPPEDVPTLIEDQRKECEKLAPKYVQEKLAKLKAKYEPTTRYAKDARVHVEESLPSNYLQLHKSKEAAIEARLGKEDLKAVAKYGEHLQALIKVTEQVLAQKLAIVAQHARDVPLIIKHANKLTDEASKIKPRVLELLKKERFGLTPNETRELVKAIIKHRELERAHGEATALLFKYAPDNPTAGLNSFVSNYQLPYWIQRKLSEVNSKK